MNDPRTDDRRYVVELAQNAKVAMRAAVTGNPKSDPITHEAVEL